MDPRHEDGIAMIMAMAATLLMGALGMALVLTTSSETIIASNFRDASEAVYAADAVLERSIDDLSRTPDWNAVLTGAAQSAFVDGAPSGRRTLADGSTIDLGEMANMANCGHVAICNEADLDAVTSAATVGDEQSAVAVVCLRSSPRHASEQQDRFSILCAGHGRR